MGEPRPGVAKLFLFESRDTSGAVGVVHDVKVPKAGDGDHGGAGGSVS